MFVKSTALVATRRVRVPDRSLRPPPLPIICLSPSSLSLSLSLSLPLSLSLRSAYLHDDWFEIGLMRMFFIARGAKKDRLRPCIQPNPQTAPGAKREPNGAVEQCAGLRAYRSNGLRSASVDIHFLIIGMLGLLRQMVGRSAPTAATSTAKTARIARRER